MRRRPMDGRTNLSLKLCCVGSALTLWADVKFEQLFEFDVAAMLLFDCDEAKLAIEFTVAGVLCVVTTVVWFK